MKLKDYQKVAVFHTGNTKPKSLRNKARICYRTSFTIAGVRFLSRIHLGQYADLVNWSQSENIFFKIYDYVEVKPNPLMEMAKTARI
jgi:hypothetical protein